MDENEIKYRGLIIRPRKLMGCCNYDPKTTYFKVTLEPPRHKNPRKNRMLFKGLSNARAAIDELFGEEPPKPSTHHRRIIPG